MFNKTEVHKGEYTVQKNWAAVVEKTTLDSVDLEIPRVSIGDDPKKLAKAVNTIVNRTIKYKKDNVLWEEAEYWATPAETIEKLSGDCEDYSILKYFLLRKFGVSADDMRIVTVKDNQVGTPHCILVVKADKNYVLDNQMSIMIEDSRIKHYEPLYSVNENSFWSYES